MAARGDTLVAELGIALGAAPGAILKASPREKVLIMNTKLDTVATSPTLHGDPVRLEALRSAAGALEHAVEANDVTLQDRMGAVEKVLAAARVLDAAYVELAEAVAKRDAAWTHKLPYFWRKVSDDEVVDDEDQVFEDPGTVGVGTTDPAADADPQPTEDEPSF